jgi:hypothetical protein
VPTDQRIRELCARVVRAEQGEEFNTAILELANAIELRVRQDEHDGKDPQKQQAD